MDHALQTPPDTIALHRRVMIAMGDIKVAHSVFALPFAVLGAFLVAPYLGDAPVHGIDWPKFSKMLVLIVVCMIFARNWAMLVNRVVDAKIDAKNPRTARRAFASGKLSRRDGYGLLASNAIAFLIACSLFGFLFGNWWPTILGVPVLIWIGFYSFTKRFTWLCHVFLGSALAVSPIAAAIAVAPNDLGSTPAVFWIASMVLFWVTGFDMIYALQDFEHDQGAGIKSVPARFGWSRAVWASRLFHLLAILSLVMSLLADDRLGWIFGAGIGLVGGLLVFEHAVLAKRGSAGIPMAFFTLNGIVSVVLGSAGVVDLVM